MGRALRLLEPLREAKKIVIGTKQTLRALENNKVAVCFIADDAEEHVVQPVKQLCEQQQVKVVRVPTMKELGTACGIDVGAAAAATLVDDEN